LIKYVVILGDGMPDYPLPELGGKTPLQYAQTPQMDSLVQRGETGMVVTVPDQMPAGSDVANLSVFGYDPLRYYTGRSPIEAVAMGIQLDGTDVAFRCNLVTLSDDTPFAKKKMLDYSADEISTPEAVQLIQEISNQLGSAAHGFYPGISYRHAMIWRNSLEELNCDLTPPHDIFNQEIGAYLPSGRSGRVILDLMIRSSAILPGHPVNRARLEKGLKPANSIWLWGQGKRPYLDKFMDKYGLNGSVISAVDLIKGLGICAGLTAETVPGATGNITTDFSGKARRALDVLHGGKDFVYVHVEAPDEAGHRGELETKIRAIEEIDEKVVKEIIAGLQDFPDFKVMVLSDHPTPLSLRTHTREAVPFVICHKGADLSNPGGEFSEPFAAGGLFFEKGYELMDYFIQKYRAVSF